MNSENKKNNELVPIEELVSLNSDVKDILDDADYSSEITDLEHQLAIVKAKEQEALIPQKYDKTNELETKTPFTVDETFRDYIEIRDIVRSTSESLKALLKSLPLDSGMLKPMMLQTIAGLYRVLHSNTKLWMEMHREMRNATNDDILKQQAMQKGSTIKEQHNTFVFEGSTSEMNERIKNGIKNVTGFESVEAEVVDE